MSTELLKSLGKFLPPQINLDSVDPSKMAPSLEEAPIRELSVKPSEEAVAFLSSLSKDGPNSAVLFLEELPIFFTDSDRTLGQNVTQVSTASFRSGSCYLVETISQATIPSSFQPILGMRSFATILKAYVTYGLETMYMFHLKHIESDMGLIESAVEIVRSDDGRTVVSSTTTTSQQVSRNQYSINPDDAVGFISEGADKIMQRLLAVSNDKLMQSGPFSGTFTGLLDADPSLAVYTMQPPTLIHTITTTNDPVIELKKNLVTEKEKVSWQTKMTATGKCLFVSQDGSSIKMEVHLDQASSESLASIESVETFGNNIELLSMYTERKKALATEHQRYVKEHPEIHDVLTDFMKSVLHRKPDDLYQFTADYFQLFRN